MVKIMNNACVLSMNIFPHKKNETYPQNLKSLLYRPSVMDIYIW